MRGPGGPGPSAPRPDRGRSAPGTRRRTPGLAGPPAGRPSSPARSSTRSAPARREQPGRLGTRGCRGSLLLLWPRCGLLQSEDLDDLRQRLASRFADLLLVQAAYRVLDDRVAKVLETLHARHGVTWPSKRVGQDRGVLDALAFEDRPVGHTGRTAGPSITDTSEDDVRVVDD